MKIISWDVGIINLAYCILEEDNRNYKILDWGTINLLNINDHQCHGFIDYSNNNSLCDLGYNS